jgi:hypothetical protein
MMKKFILDYSIWRFGGMPNQFEKGATKLLNKQGYMCCLGQWCEQSGVPKDELLGHKDPSTLRRNIEPFNQGVCGLYLSDFSNRAMRINDNQFTTAEEKIYHLKNLCRTHDIELQVINKPEINLQD